MYNVRNFGAVGCHTVWKEPGTYNGHPPWPSVQNNLLDGHQLANLTLFCTSFSTINSVCFFSIYFLWKSLDICYQFIWWGRTLCSTRWRWLSAPRFRHHVQDKDIDWENTTTSNLQNPPTISSSRALGNANPISGGVGRTRRWNFARHRQHRLRNPYCVSGFIFACSFYVPFSPGFIIIGRSRSV